MSSLRRLARHKVGLRRRVSTSHALRFFRCCAVLSELLFSQNNKISVIRKVLPRFLFYIL